MDVIDDFGVPVYDPCTRSTGHGNDFELIPTVKMEIRHPIDGSLGNEFSSVNNRCGLMAA